MEKIANHTFDRFKKKAQNEDGVILIIALWVVVIMSAVALSFAFQARMDVKMAGYQANYMKAKWFAEAGVSQALVLLREDLLKDHGVLENEDLIDVDDDDIFLYDSYSEAWSTKEDLLRPEVDDDEKAKGYFYVYIEDEGGKLNINSENVTPEVLENLLKVLEAPEEVQMPIAAAIVDWRDGDDNPSDGGEDAEFGDEESEMTYYNPDLDKEDVLEGGEGYLCKNQRFDFPEELLMVKFMEPIYFFGEDQNHNGELDDNERDGELSPPSDNEDGSLQLGLRDYVTTFGDGKININTASEKVIQALLYPELGDDAEDMAEKIVDYRNGLDRDPGTRDDRPIRTLDDSDGDDFDLSEVDGLDGTALSTIKKYSKVNSNIFTIVSSGYYSGIKATIRQTVSRRFIEEVNLVSNEEGREDVIEEDPGDGSHEQVRFITFVYNVE